MSKEQCLDSAKTWIEQAQTYVYRGMIDKADACVKIATRLVNQATAL